MDNNEMKDNMDSPVGENMPLNGFEQSQMSQGMPQQFGQGMMPMGDFGQPQFGHIEALSETSCPHSLHLISAIFNLF